VTAVKFILAGSPPELKATGPNRAGTHPKTNHQTGLEPSKPFAGVAPERPRGFGVSRGAQSCACIAAMRRFGRCDEWQADCRSLQHLQLEHRRRSSLESSGSDSFRL
jgi:hypothetical protein